MLTLSIDRSIERERERGEFPLKVNSQCQTTKVNVSDFADLMHTNTKTYNSVKHCTCIFLIDL